jgi:dGTPase
MAQAIGVDPDVVDTACLAHDLGHPPFGHNGEKALSIWAEDFGGFEGNAQTLRLLSRIEPKVIDSNGQTRGLNLTRASLDASCKYPWARSEGVAEAGGNQSVKFGYYEDDSEVFEFLRKGSISNRKCIEAEVMDFADDVAYSVHDFEDAVVSGYVDLAELASASNHKDLFSKIQSWAAPELSIDEIQAAFGRLSENLYWLTSYSSSMADQATLKNLTSYLIGSFVGRSTTSTLESNASAHLVRYNGSLVVPSDVRGEIAVLKGIVSVFLMTDEKRQPYYTWQREVLTELADALLASNGKHLDHYCQSVWAEAKTESQKYRVVVDQVASLTDVSALNLHAELKGK